jgi:hypothetical protein
VSGIEEDADGHGHLAAGDEVVEDDGRAPVARRLHIIVSILEDHDGRRLLGLVLRGHVNPPVAGRPGEYL